MSDEPLVLLANELREARTQINDPAIADLLKRAERAVRQSEEWRRYWRERRYDEQNRIVGRWVRDEQRNRVMITRKQTEAVLESVREVASWAHNTDAGRAIVTLRNHILEMQAAIDFLEWRETPTERAGAERQRAAQNNPQ